MLWVEGRLGPVERACMRSVLLQGHRLVVWHYYQLEDVPEGVELKDAASVVPREQIFRHHPTGSYALFSNLFRYRLLQLNCGIWLDTDIYLLKPIHSETRFLYAFEEPGLVASGVLDLPADSPALSELIGYFDGRSVPPWLPMRWRLRFGMQKLARGRFRLETMPWGYLGPRALTTMLEKHGLINHARPSSEFYPYDWRDAAWVFDPAIPLERWLQPDTIGIHLYNQIIRDRKNDEPPPDSFMARLHLEGA